MLFYHAFSKSTFLRFWKYLISISWYTYLLLAAFITVKDLTAVKTLLLSYIIIIRSNFFSWISFLWGGNNKLLKVLSNVFFFVTMARLLFKYVLGEWEPGLSKSVSTQQSCLLDGRNPGIYNFFINVLLKYFGFFP